MTLNNGIVNEAYKIKNMNLPTKIEKRLEALGMIEGTEIAVLNMKNQGTLIIKVRGTRFAIGKNISKRIEVI